MKNKTKEDIKQICTNYGEEVKKYGVGTISYALTEEQFNKLFEYIEKNFVAKGEVREMLIGIDVAYKNDKDLEIGKLLKSLE